MICALFWVCITIKVLLYGWRLPAERELISPIVSVVDPPLKLKNPPIATSPASQKASDDAESTGTLAFVISVLTSTLYFKMYLLLLFY